jgi:Beta-propeller repeat/S-layer homology domain
LQYSFLLLLPALAHAGQERPYANSPLYFEPNIGQHAANVRYLARAAGYTLFLTGREAVISSRGTATRIRFAGSHGLDRLEPIDPQRGVSNYYIGADRSKWRAGIPHYGRIRAAGVYPGIDVVFHERERDLEYDFEIAPGADPRRIELEFPDAAAPRIDRAGQLHIGDVTMPPPRSWQQAGAQQVEVRATYRLRRGNHVAIDLGPYDRGRALVIDPILALSTYLGGTGADIVGGIALDIVGNAYLCGSTTSADFPKAPKPPNGFRDAFVLGLNNSGSQILFTTFLGGNGQDACNAIAVDANGDIYVGGSTASTDFPTLAPIQGSNAGTTDGFVTKLTLGGGLLYSTYLGGEGIDIIRGIAVDASHSAYVTGHTYSSGFPVTAGAFRTTKAAGSSSADAFAAKLTPGGDKLAYSTFLAGINDDFGISIAVDAVGNAYVGGQTVSIDYPTTPGALQPTLSIAPDGFLTKLNPAGSGLIYSTYLGGDGLDAVFSIDLDDAGRIYAAGQTNSSDFPQRGGLNLFTKPPTGFVSKINSLGSGLVYSTLIGGSGGDSVSAVRVNQIGQAYVTGRTASFDFPGTAFGVQPLRAGLDDAFFAVLNPVGTALSYSTFFGGSDNDSGTALALDKFGSAWFTGQTMSTDFPFTTDALQPTFKGDQDIFVVKFVDFRVFPCLPAITGTDASFTADGGSVMYSITAGSDCSWSSASSAGFVTLGFGTLGSGNGLVSYTVATNGGSLPRTASISTSGNIVNVIQSAANPTAPFSDVPTSNPFADYIALIKASGITSGCSPTSYCPDLSTTRGQMAVFIIRALMGGDNFPFPATPYFTDVPVGNPFFRWIQKMRELGITSGCSPVTYCPDAPVTRGQMSVFLIRALLGNTFNASATPYFTDVPANHPFFPFIQKMKEWGITSGCSATQYCPDDNTTRGQMAVFLVRAFLTPR